MGEQKGCSWKIWTGVGVDITTVTVVAMIGLVGLTLRRKVVTIQDGGQMIVTTENRFEELAIVKAEGVCLRMGG